MPSQKLLSVVGGLLLSFSLISAQGFVSYYGNNRKAVVYVQVSDSLAYVEYSYNDLRGTYHSKFDTLKCYKNKYTGSFSQIRIDSNKLLFKPGKITLSHQKPDSSFNRIRNMGYLQMINSRYQMALAWTGANLNDFSIEKWKSEKMILTKPEDYKKIIVHTYDSLYHYYTSQAYARRFNKVIIKNGRLFSKKCIESTDSVEISKIWQKLSFGSPIKRSLFCYLGQYPIAILIPVMFTITFEFSLLVSPLIYSTLIYAEKFVGNRFSAGSTYKIIFLSTQNKVNKCLIKIRKSKIIRDDYIYILPFNFEKILFNGLEK
jgi:hypothetical protein